MIVSKFLGSADQLLISCAPEDALSTIAAVLSEKRIGALPVVNSQDLLVGIISERDLLRAYAQTSSAAAELQVRDVMTTQVITVKPADDFELVHRLMTQHHIRHIPVVENTRVLAMLSIRDLMSWRKSEALSMRERLTERLQQADEAIRNANEAARRKS